MRNSVRRYSGSVDSGSRGLITFAWAVAETAAGFGGTAVSNYGVAPIYGRSQLARMLRYARAHGTVRRVCAGRVR